jgi:hypothetical protein
MSTVDTERFYLYAIFVSWTIVFFAVLAVFYSYMETGILLPTPSPTKPTEHIFEWMKETEPNIEPITDMTYQDNKVLEQNINNLKDPVYQIALNAVHMKELADQNGPPYPNMYYIEPFQDSANISGTFSTFVKA